MKDNMMGKNILFDCAGKNLEQNMLFSTGLHYYKRIHMLKTNCNLYAECFAPHCE
jgi:hypothetical protein